MERGGKGGGRDRVGFEMIPNGSAWSRWIPWAYQSRWTVVGDTGPRVTDDYGISSLRPRDRC